ncbi:hypothetical protein JCM8115_001948 [Rhodotorula mucilaginosa]|nr:hypothetical protein B0A53_03985 [Rhodotorula sp. CCFEE 5036]
MQGAVAAPIPSRPLGRTRRRSSSLSVISNASPSSPAASLWTDHRSPSKPGIKRMKRTRCTTGGESPLASHSPLKQALPLFEAPEEDLYYSSFWATPNPFALRTHAAPQAYPPTAVPAPFPADAAAAFCTSATEFALPSTSSRSRNASTDDDAAALSSSNASLASSKGSFDDSSFASDSPGDSSLPSTSSSPHSPPPRPYPPNLPAATTSSSRSRTTLVLTNPSMRPPSLRRSSSCGSCSPMLTESNALPPVWDPVVAAAASEELGQAESLHRAAFEQLRHATHAEGEGFVERMRRWESERSARDALFGLGGGSMLQSRASDLAPSIGAGDGTTGGGIGDDDDEEEEEDDEDLCGDDDDEIDILLDPLDGDMLEFVPTRPPAQRVSHAELDELAQRLRTGACEVEDYALVRDVQARYRTRTRSVA